MVCSAYLATFSKKVRMITECTQDRGGGSSMRLGGLKDLYTAEGST